MKFSSLIFLFLFACNGCVKAPPPSSATHFGFYTPEAFSSVGMVKVVTSAVRPTDGQSKEFTRFGTGWSIATERGKSLVVTAGHVCPNNGDPVGDGFVSLSNKVTFIDYNGNERSTRELLDDEDVDFCLLAIDGAVRPMTLSNVSPVVGAGVTYVGYPDELFAIVDGRWVGTKNGRGLLTATLHTYPGASGAPVLDSTGRVVGMVARYDAGFNGVAFLVPLSDIRRLLGKQTK